VRASLPAIAAGALVWRRADHGIEVVVVHRPRYDDWSFPKGKLDPGEHLLGAAIREVAEETGLTVRLGPPVAVQTYPISTNGIKEVHYWSARQIGDSDVRDYLPNAEIDEVCWLPVAKARKGLTYERDVGVLSAFLETPLQSRPLVVLRHARARSRSSWKFADASRTLTQAGHDQAPRLVPVLQAYDIQRIVSSDAVRCIQTVEPFSAETMIEIELDHRLSEEGADPMQVRRAVRRMLASKNRIVICSHRPVLPEILRALGVEDSRLRPGGFLVAHHRGGRVQATEIHDI
jgi:8-oxo-(d)GTP phosphatase